MTGTTTPKRAKRRVAIPAVIAGGLSSLLLAFSMTPTFSALTAAISNDSNTAGTGTLVMTETSTDMSTTCTSGATGSASCTTINKFGGNTANSGYMTLKPGGSVTSNITIKNSGTINAATFTVLGGKCTKGTQGLVNGSATEAQLCGAFTVVITDTAFPTVPIYTGTAAGLESTTKSLAAVPAGSTVTLTVKITLASTADASYQGLTISQPITWTFAA